MHQSETLAAQLQQALTSRVTIEQAKGFLAERLGISVDEAFTLLRGYARSNNLRLSDLARDVANRSAAAAPLFETPQPTAKPARPARTL